MLCCRLYYVGECPMCLFDIGKADVCGFAHALKRRRSAERCTYHLYYLCAGDRSIRLEGAVRISVYKSCGCRRDYYVISCVCCRYVCKAYRLIRCLYLAHIVDKLNELCSCYRLVGLEASAVALEIAKAFKICYVVVIPCARLYVCKCACILTLDGGFINKESCNYCYSLSAGHLSVRLEGTSLIACDKGIIDTLAVRSLFGLFFCYLFCRISLSRFLGLEECKCLPRYRITFKNLSGKREEAHITLVDFG